MTGQSLPLVTALVPTYNGATFIEATLESLAAQTWPNLEILVGNDCSTDNTIEVVRAFAAKHPNVRLIDNPTNLGWLENSNNLMREARGELMFFAFHDDLVLPPFVERLVGVLRDNPQAILAFSDMEVCEPGETTGIVQTFTALDNAHTAFDRGVVMIEHPLNWWVPNHGIFRASAFARSGGIKRNKKGEYSADWTWMLHLALLGDFIRVPEALCRKFYQSTSVSKNWKRNRAKQRLLRQAGRREVWNSSLPLSVRLALVLYAKTRRRIVGRQVMPVFRRVASRLLR